jgi:hypothetical protein
VLEGGGADRLVDDFALPYKPRNEVKALSGAKTRPAR